MVSMKDMRASNAQISASLPPSLTAVFVGGTSGIGEYTLIQFAKAVPNPRIYFTGRAQDAADRIIQECQTINPKGEYMFLRKDCSLIKNVDEVCKDIFEAERKRQNSIGESLGVNLLFMTQGTLATGTETSEGLHRAAAIGYHARTRFVLNLLPLVRKAKYLRRVVSVLAGTKEGPVDTNDPQGWKVPLRNARGHICSMVTLTLERIAESAPEVSFVHDFPGYVRGGVTREGTGAIFAVIRFLDSTFGPLLRIPDVECGERQLFIATSARYQAKLTGAAESDGQVEGENKTAINGVPLVSGMEIARGTDGKPGSGVYSVDSVGAPASAEFERLFVKMREDGTQQKVWEHLEAELQRITGSMALQL